MQKILTEIEKEVVRANRIHGEFNSLHEGYAVLMEEIDELWEEIKHRNTDLLAIREEAIQVAAMALKMVMFIDSKEEK